MRYRYRMQSLKTGWGMEGEPTPEGKTELEKVRKQHPAQYKFSRIYLAKQMIPFHHDVYRPFRLTSIKDILQ